MRNNQNDTIDLLTKIADTVGCSRQADPSQREWNVCTRQKSSPQLLEAGKKYYFRVVRTAQMDIENLARRVAVGTTLGRYTNLFPSVIPYCNSHNQRHVLTISFC